MVMLDSSFHEKRDSSIVLHTALVDAESKQEREGGIPANVQFADTFVGSVPIKNAAQKTSLFLTETVMSQLGLLPTEDNVTLLANGLPALRHGFDTLSQVCMYIGMVCFGSIELKKFKHLANAAASGGAMATAAMLAGLLEYLNSICGRHQQIHAKAKDLGAVVTEQPSLMCLCPNHFCPIFVMRLFSGTEVLSRVLTECFRAGDARQSLALRVAWRLFHISQVCVNRCSRFRCLTLKDEPRMAFWQRVQGEICKGPSREVAFQCVLGLIVDRTEGDVDDEVDLFRNDIVNPLLIPMAFSLLRGTPLDFQLKGVTSFFSGLLGQSSLISPVHDLAVCIDHQLGILHLLSDLGLSDFKDVSLAGDVELTLVAYLLTLFMTYFDKSNFTPCMNHALAVINSWGPPTSGYRRVYLMRQVLVGLLSTVKRECGTIARDMGQIYSNFTNLATTVLQFCLFHGYPAPVSCGWSHFPHLADLLRESFLPAPDPDDLPKHWSSNGGVRLHVCARLVPPTKVEGVDIPDQQPQWELVVEDIDLLRKLEEIFKGLDLDHDMFRGPEDTKKIIRRGAQLHRLVISLLGVFVSAKANDSRVSLVAASYPTRRKEPKFRRHKSTESLNSISEEKSFESPSTPRSPRSLYPTPPDNTHNRTKSSFEPLDMSPTERAKNTHHQRTVSAGLTEEPKNYSQYGTSPLPTERRGRSGENIYRSLPEQPEVRERSSRRPLERVISPPERAISPPERAISSPERAASPNRGSRCGDSSSSGNSSSSSSSSGNSCSNSSNSIRPLSPPGRSRGERMVNPERAISPERNRAVSPERNRAASPSRRAVSPSRRAAGGGYGCEEQCAAQNTQMGLVRSMVTALEAVFSSGDGAAVTKHFLNKKPPFESYLNSSHIMEGSLLVSRLSHGVAYNGRAKFQLERDRLCYTIGDRKHSVPLVFIKAISLDAPYPETKAEETLHTFSVVSKVDSFLAAAHELEARDSWVNLLSWAISRVRLEHRGQGDSLEGLHVLASGTFRGGPLASRSSPSLSKTLFGFRQIRVSVNKPAILRVQKTDLVPIYTADQKCTSCDANLVFRKLQHCRRCGRGFCQKCISRLKGRRFQLSKVCTKCFEELEERADSNQQAKEQMSTQATFAPGTKAVVDQDLAEALQAVALRKHQLEQSLSGLQANRKHIEDEIAQCQKQLEELAQKQIQSLTRT